MSAPFARLLPIAGLLTLLGALTACESDEECGESSNCLELCEELDAAACEASERCGAIQGKPLVGEEEADFCLDVEAEFEEVGCMPIEGGCTDAEVYALDPDGVGYYFSNGCIPSDFQAMEEAVGECEEGA